MEVKTLFLASILVALTGFLMVSPGYVGASEEVEEASACPTWVCKITPHGQGGGRDPPGTEADMCNAGSSGENCASCCDYCENADIIVGTEMCECTMAGRHRQEPCEP